MARRVVGTETRFGQENSDEFTASFSWYAYYHDSVRLSVGVHWAYDWEMGMSFGDTIYGNEDVFQMTPRLDRPRFICLSLTILSYRVERTSTSAPLICLASSC